MSALSSFQSYATVRTIASTLNTSRSIVRVTVYFLHCSSGNRMSKLLKWFARHHLTCKKSQQRFKFGNFNLEENNCSGASRKFDEEVNRRNRSTKMRPRREKNWQKEVSIRLKQFNLCDKILSLERKELICTLNYTKHT